MKLLKEINFVPFLFLLITWHTDLKPLILLFLWICFGISELILIRMKRTEKANRIRLENGSFYMEQMILSFRRHHKILAALRDVSVIAPDGMGEVLRSTSDELESGFTDGDEFRHAFLRIEDRYGNHLMRRIHEFLIHVEEQGGECETALEILLSQVRSRMKNEKISAEKYQLMRSRLTLSIMLSCLINLMVVRIIPDGCLPVDIKLYQVGNGTAFFLYQMLYLFFYRITIRSSDGICSEKQERKAEKQAERWYDIIVSGHHGFSRHLAAIRMEREIRLFFPDWLFDMFLRLQTENLQTALHHSLDSAPEILIRPLCRLIRQVEADPVSGDPYHDFLKDMDLPEIHSMMLQLYAVNFMGREDIPNQICAMLEQQRLMQEHADQVHLEEKLTGIGLLAAVPMMISVLLMLLNAGLGMLLFLQKIKG